MSLADHACQLVVDFMSRTGSDYAAPDRFADQCQVTDHIDQLVACRLVVEYQRFIVDVAQVLYVLMRDRQLVGKIVEHLLRYFLVIDDDRIVEVTTLIRLFCNSISTSRTNTNVREAANSVGEFTQVVQRGELVGKHRRIEGKSKTLTLNLSSGRIMREEPVSSSLTSILCFLRYK